MRATVSGALLITRAFATTRSIIRARKPYSISALALAIGATELWLTQKAWTHVHAPLSL